MAGDDPKDELSKAVVAAARRTAWRISPRVTFRLPDGPYKVVEEPAGLVNIFARGRKHPILTMPRSAADAFGWTEPESSEPPTSGTQQKR